MKEKNSTKRGLALLCIAAMFCSLVPTAGWAEEEVADFSFVEEVSYEEPAADFFSYEEPAVDFFYYEEPAVDYYYEEPAADYYYEEPAADYYYEEPASSYEDYSYEQPAAEQSYEEPGSYEPTVEDAAAAGDLDALALALAEAVEEQYLQEVSSEGNEEVASNKKANTSKVDDFEDDYFDVEAAYWYYMSLSTQAEREEYLRSLSPANRRLLLEYIRLMEQEAYYEEQAYAYEQPTVDPSEQYSLSDQQAVDEKVMEQAAAAGDIDALAMALADSVRHVQEKIDQLDLQSADQPEEEPGNLDLSFLGEFFVEEDAAPVVDEEKPVSSAEEQYNAFMALETEEEKTSEYDAMSSWEQKKLDNIIKLNEIDAAILQAATADPVGEPESEEVPDVANEEIAQSPSAEKVIPIEDPYKVVLEEENDEENSEAPEDNIESFEEEDEENTEVFEEDSEEITEESAAETEENAEESEAETEENVEETEEEADEEADEEENKEDDEEEKEEEPEENIFTVRFFDFDGVQIGGDQLVKEGEAAEAPEIPEKEGIEFLGWSEDFTSVTSDLDIYPLTEEAEPKDAESEEPEEQLYTVRFFDFDGVQIGEDQLVKEGEAAEAPEIPEKEGVEFLGWSEDFTSVTSDLDIYPLTEEPEEQLYTVRFFDFDGVQIGEDQLVKEGEAAEAPEIPEKEGVEFLGWSEDFTSVTSDLDIYPLIKEEQHERTPINAYIWHESADGGEIGYGSEVIFYAEVDGAEAGDTVNYQWQISYDGASWTDVPGATGMSHTITIDESNAQSFWRLVVNT